jgi:hypothetical protein
MPRDDPIEQERIPRFKLEHLPWASAVILLGKRRSGKTVAMMEMIRHFGADMNIVFAGSDGSYQDFCKVTSPLHVYDAFTDVGVVDRVLQDLMTLVKDPNVPRPKKIAVWLDDLGCDDVVMKSKIVLDLFAKGRHMNTVPGPDGPRKIGLTVVVAIQYAKMIGPKLRSNCDFLFCFRLASYECQLAVQKGYTTLKPDRFSGIMDNLHTRKKYASLVIDNSTEAQVEGRGISWHRAAVDTSPGEFTGSEDVNALCARLLQADFYRDAVAVVVASVGPCVSVSAEPSRAAPRRRKPAALVEFSDDDT